MDIKPTDLVLEIGSGHNPHPRADVLCDRYLSQNKERAGFDLCFDRPLVIAEGTRLPFKSKVFDYVICSQVIEHIVDPERFVKELSRVGRRGIIVCPHAIRERLFGWHHHRWYILLRDNILQFLPKTKENCAVFGQFFHSLYQGKIFFRRFCTEQEQRLNIYYEWQGKVDISFVSDQQKDEIIKKIDKNLEGLLQRIDWNTTKDVWFYLSWLTERARRRLQKEKRRMTWQEIKNYAFLRKIVCCPLCYGKLKKMAGKLVCLGCQTSYPLRGNIPILLESKERQRGY